MEWYGLFHPVRPGGWGVGVYVESPRHVRLGLARHHPLRVVVLVAAVVQWNYVHQEDVFGVRIQAFQAGLEGGKHTPTRKEISI